jgi:sugar phosphate isomerase/epimerase
MWLLDRCVEYDFKALEASLPLSGTDEPVEVKAKATDLGITYVGYWSENFVTPDGGAAGLRDRGQRALDIAVECGVSTVVAFGSGSKHNRFTNDPPLDQQLTNAVDNLGPVAEEAAARNVRIGLLPHLDYRSHEMFSVAQRINHPALRMAFDTTNPFPVCEEPVDAARNVLPHAIAVAIKDVQIYPHRSNDVTIWGAPIGQGSVNFDAIFDLMRTELPEPDTTTVCVKLRLPPDSTDHDTWMKSSLEYLASHPAFQALLTP